MRAKHYFKGDERFSVEARLGVTMRGYWEDWKFYRGKIVTVTGSVGGNFYWPKYNTQFSVKGERYLLEEFGVRADMIRHFRYASIGFWANRVFGKDDAAHKGFNAGFLFQITCRLTSISGEAIYRGW